MKDYEAIKKIWEDHRGSREWLSYLIEIYIQARDSGKSPAAALKIQEVAYLISENIDDANMS